MNAETLVAARSLLFAPGDRPELFAKAAGSGADAIILDLEDAVAPSGKDTALRHVREWLEAGHDAIVRINGAGTPWHDTELSALPRRPLAIMVPKAESSTALAAVVAKLPAGSIVVPLIETAAGVLEARSICAGDAVVRAAFGHIDLAAQLGVDPDSSDTLNAARTTLVLASAAAGCAPPLDGVTTALDSPETLDADVRRARSLGFTGKLCIHPRQVEAVHRGFRPSEADLAWARKIVAADAGGAAVAVDGRMVDRPVVERARRTLREHGRITQYSE